MSEHEAFEQLGAMVRERDWDQFHSPGNLAKSIAIEAAELLECFQWTESASDERVTDELADVLTYCYLLAAKLGVSPSQVVLTKLTQTRLKYPVEKARGNSIKSTEL